jgi:hypothetical protein
VCQNCAELKRQLETPTDHYQGLKAGDPVAVQWTDQVTIPATVVSTCEYGALARCPKPDGIQMFDMYVRYQNHRGHWYP